jgi:hypothetical protein
MLSIYVVSAVQGSVGRWQTLYLAASDQSGQDAVQPLEQVSGREAPCGLPSLAYSTI